MGIDTQLIDDGTYFVVEPHGDIAGCGGWRRRATLYGGNQAPGRDNHLLDPVVDPARVRAGPRLEAVSGRRRSRWLPVGVEVEPAA